ncbi:MAG TPA: thioredoxin domain-containing protein [Xanthobacteraceae bacterium]|jgi:protein-disulfide isomerase
MGTLRVPVTQHDHIKGPMNAPATLVEYGDYECPGCGAAHPIVNRVLEHFGSRLRFVFRHFPLTLVHPNAESAAESAEFAGAYRLFWEMHDGIYENQDRLNPPLLFALARALGLSEEELSDALVSEKYAAKIKSDFLSGVRSGVNGTPSFFINGHQHQGSFALNDLVLAIDVRLHAQASL